MCSQNQFDRIIWKESLISKVDTPVNEIEVTFFSGI